MIYIYIYMYHICMCIYIYIIVNPERHQPSAPVDQLVSNTDGSK